MSRLPQVPVAPRRLARTAAVALALTGGLALTTAPPASAARKCTQDKLSGVTVCINQHDASPRAGFYAVASFRNPSARKLKIRPALTDEESWAYKGSKGLTLLPRRTKTIKVYHEAYTRVCAGFYLPAKSADKWAVSVSGHICGAFSEGLTG